MIYTYLSQLTVLLKNTSPTILLSLTVYQIQLSMDGAGLRGLDVDSVNSCSDYFAYLCIPASETKLHQNRMSTADQSHHQQQTAETSCKNEPC
jgi:hypothetical protein